VIAALQEINLPIPHQIHNPVFIRQAARPGSAMQVFEGLRLPDTGMGIAQNGFDQIKSAESQLSVRFNPIARSPGISD